jgi:hypothetical protein
MTDPESAREAAKAVQEVAKATQSAIEASREAGGFLARYLDGPLTQMSGLLEDRLKYARSIRLVRLRQKFQEEVQALGIQVPIQQLPVNFALAALEEGSLEDDDELQNLWARLLANTVDANSGVAPRRAHISMIRDMSRLDALIFEAIYSVPDVPGGKAIVTYELPGKAYRADGMKADEVPEPSEEIILSLSNLERIGAIAFGSSWGGAEIFRFANKTTAGRELMRAIKRRSA